MKNNSTKSLVTAGLCIALSQILSYLKVLEMPQGGSVTCGSMVPIILFALIYGMGPGLLAAFVYGLLQFVLGGVFSLHPLSIIIDYLLGFGVLGFAGIFSAKKNTISATLGALLASCLRFVMVVLSGAVVWKAYAPEGMNPWIYSITYNASYMIPETILTVILVALLFKRVYKFMK
ncbi:energy-coupled thiamine transporter ThiT [Peptoniphilus raoultii]|uniref:energy-coupled thiamine transporter ThiT n=1 Tax=Peptoniphilus raoultii TaxID=1776387 RepID=UPI0008DA753E|nr:energy-coupled thiamine transporter ThiT [Peptoniphilus raoultii]